MQCILIFFHVFVVMYVVMLHDVLKDTVNASWHLFIFLHVYLTKTSCCAYQCFIVA